MTQSGRGSVQSCSGTAFAADALPPLAASQNVRWRTYIKSEFIIGADGFRICAGLIRITRWEVIMPQPRKFRLAKAADWPAPLPGMWAADVSCLY
jgi:hypothetical protein